MSARVALSWACYRSGELWCDIAVRRGLGHYFEWPYRIYNRLMIWSFNLQNYGPGGPWQMTRAKQPSAQGGE